MKYTLITIFAVFIMSCQENTNKYAGPPIITKKTVSLNGETCIYTYIGYGREKIMNKTEKLRNSRAYGTRAHETPNIGTPTKSRTIK